MSGLSGGRIKDEITVLVADDDRSLLRLVTRILGREGLRVEGVVSGAEVIERVAAGGSFLLLLDYSLPDMNGRKVMEELRSRGHDAPFIIMTGHGDERIAVDMMKLGARDYVMKDVAFVDLLPSIVGQALEQLEVERRLRVTEEGLRESEEKFAKAFRASPDWILIITLQEALIMEANDTFVESSGFSRGEVIGTSCKALGICVNPSHWREMFDALQSGEEFRNMEMQVRTKSAQERTLLMSAESFSFDGVDSAICVAHDITERKRDQEKIMASLREKDVLLKEIHHRVKNNLQVISSLLSLQGKGLEDENMKGVFKEVSNRVKSIAMAHEMLYTNKDLSAIGFRDYVGAILDNLYRSFGVSRSHVRYELDIEDVRMEIDYAVPCGLIINELVSNALKFAFPGQGGGGLRISVKLAPSEDSTAVTMMVEDDGVGLPRCVNFADVSDKSGSLGLRLVRILSERQLGGTVSCESGIGTKYSIGFIM